MTVDSVIKLIKAMKPNQCYLIGGTLITAGLAGSSSPFWYPLAEDVIRNTLNLASESDGYSASPATLLLSVFTMILGVVLILVNRYLEHQERVQSNEVDNVVPLRPQSKSRAFEADSGGEVIINGGRVKNYERVAKASNKGVVKLNDTDVER
ncbi:hypothetical protein ACLINW_002761 [Vibrio parahaemolyticus]|nr:MULTISPECIES: hypothetical protein [Vibrio]EJL6398258.1 hypothetical protein [Vibrio navarrensis]EHJ9978641.1 hypothetical protein [Vibrio parahaemolyticus]EJG1725615.1 hypothetical protein [Vibrio parahaemolyticus]EJG1738076.1 hypothetical protein [Vibrio parahaemolyticus]EJG1751377.1 hypothetical protein [Vibrio parahaemolyticus]